MEKEEGSGLKSKTPIFKKNKQKRKRQYRPLQPYIYILDWKLIKGKNGLGIPCVKMAWMDITMRWWERERENDWKELIKDLKVILTSE